MQWAPLELRQGKHSTFTWGAKAARLVQVDTMAAVVEEQVHREAVAPADLLVVGEEPQMYV